MLYLNHKGLIASACILTALVAGAACSANGTARPDDLTGGGNPSGGSGTGNTTTGPTGLNTSSSSSSDGDGGCQTAKINFTPQISKVFILVDRSGSMFQSNAWQPLHDGVIEVLQQWQDKIRFGFAAFTGEIGQTCPLFDEVPIALNNAAAIGKVYDKLGMPTKGETPTGLALAKVRDLLDADPNPGEKYILFVTDGEPDYCDDGNAICPVDSVVAKLQALYEEKISTFVFGLKSTLSTISDDTLQAFANAGAGQPPAFPPGYDTTRIYNECYNGGVVGWKADYAAANMTAMRAIGTWAAQGGTATLFRPGTNKDELAMQIGGVISGLKKSCKLDLTGQVEVNNPGQLNSQNSHVVIQGIQRKEVPMSMDNGWHMNSSTELELSGEACKTWQDPASTDIDADFPCDAVVAK